jgi:hypothetical protein
MTITTTQTSSRQDSNAPVFVRHTDRTHMMTPQLRGYNSGFLSTGRRSFRSYFPSQFSLDDYKSFEKSSVYLMSRVTAANPRDLSCDLPSMRFAEQSVYALVGPRATDSHAISSSISSQSHSPYVSHSQTTLGVDSQFTALGLGMGLYLLGYMNRLR